MAIVGKVYIVSPCSKKKEMYLPHDQKPQRWILSIFDELRIKERELFSKDLKKLLNFLHVCARKADANVVNAVYCTYFPFFLFLYLHC